MSVVWMQDYDRLSMQQPFLSLVDAANEKLQPAAWSARGPRDIAGPGTPETH